MNILIIILSIGVWGNAFCAGKLREFLGPFAVCAEGHFTHGKCFKGWNKNCPECRDTSIVVVPTAMLKPKSECSICLDSYGDTQAVVDKPKKYMLKVVKKDPDCFLKKQAAASDLLAVHLRIKQLRRESISIAEAQSAYKRWDYRNRNLKIAVKDSYLRRALVDKHKEGLIFRAEFSPKSKDKLRDEVASERTEIIEEAARLNFHEFGYTTETLDKYNIIKILNCKIRK
jgi:hypothetical protein